MTLSKAFGIHLRKSRLAHGFSQEDLAIKAGIHRTYVSQLERGLKTPSLAVVFKLCQTLDTEPERFIAEVRQQMECL